MAPTPVFFTVVSTVSSRKYHTRTVAQLSCSSPKDRAVILMTKSRQLGIARVFPVSCSGAKCPTIRLLEVGFPRSWKASLLVGAQRVFQLVAAVPSVQLSDYLRLGFLVYGKLLC